MAEGENHMIFKAIFTISCQLYVSHLPNKYHTNFNLFEMSVWQYLSVSFTFNVLLIFVHMSNN